MQQPWGGGESGGGVGGWAVHGQQVCMQTKKVSMYVCMYVCILHTGYAGIVFMYVCMYVYSIQGMQVLYVCMYVYYRVTRSGSFDTWRVDICQQISQ